MGFAGKGTNCDRLAALLNLSMSVKSKAKLVRIVLGSTVGSLLWAGCAEPRVSVTDPQLIAAAPVDLTKRRPDTNPELRVGMWQTGAEWQAPQVVLAPAITEPNGLPGAQDPAYLLGYSPEVVNAVPPESQGGIIIEAAGAESNAPRRTWRERWFRRSEPANTPPPVQNYEKEIIIEREAEPQPDVYKPSSDKGEDEGGKLMRSFFVKK